SQYKQTFAQTLVAQLRLAEFFLRPIHRLSCGPARRLNLRQSEPLGYLAQLLTRSFSQRIKENTLERFACGVGGIIASTAGRSVGQRNPIAGSIRTAPVFVFFHEALQQQGPIAIAALPMKRQLPHGHRQHMTGQVPDFHSGPNQKATIVDNVMEVFPARRVLPANPLVTRAQATSRGTKTQHAQNSLWATDQVAQLSSAQKIAQGMKLLEQAAALVGGLTVAAADQHQFHRSDLRQVPTDARQFEPCGLGSTRASPGSMGQRSCRARA